MEKPLTQSKRSRKRSVFYNTNESSESDDGNQNEVEKNKPKNVKRRRIVIASESEDSSDEYKPTSDHESLTSNDELSEIDTPKKKVMRPFLLSRVKSDVEKQLPKKYKHVVLCKLSNRQQYLYDDIMSQAKTKETLATGNVLSVINILMQLRKVCNHPNMFEERATLSPFMMKGMCFHTASLALKALDDDLLKAASSGSLVSTNSQIVAPKPALVGPQQSFSNSSEPHKRFNVFRGQQVASVKATLVGIIQTNAAGTRLFKPKLVTTFPLLPTFSRTPISPNTITIIREAPFSGHHASATTTNNTCTILNVNKEKVTEDGMPLPKVQLYKGKIQVKWKQVSQIGAGLTNLGNSCFMNTVIQCLTYCPPLANYLLLDNDHSSKCNAIRGGNGFCMMCIMQEHMKKAIGKQGEVLRPDGFYKSLKLIAKHFQYGRQEDAHEFLRYVIDNLWKSCLPLDSFVKLDSASKETTVINQIFGGYHRSQVICLTCKEKSNTFDHFMDLILDIKQDVSTLYEALDKFILPELLQKSNSYNCTKCKTMVTAQKKFTVHKDPNVATFQLKRFDYNRKQSRTKIAKKITYPEKLNLRPYMSDPQGHPVWYCLNAVLVHSGKSCKSGHYYCYVKNSNGNWYMMNDSMVKPVQLSTVLDETAYVLFYIKTESAQGSTPKKFISNLDSSLKGSISGSKQPISSRPAVAQSAPRNIICIDLTSDGDEENDKNSLLEQTVANDSSTPSLPTKKLLNPIKDAEDGGVKPKAEEALKVDARSNVIPTRAKIDYQKNEKQKGSKQPISSRPAVAQSAPRNIICIASDGDEGTVQSHFQTPTNSPLVHLLSNPTPKLEVPTEKKNSLFYLDALSKEREECRHATLGTMAFINSIRCLASVMYGQDIVEALTLDHKLNVVRYREDSRCFWKHMPALSSIVKTPEDRVEEMCNIVKRFVFVVPAVIAPPLEMHVSHPHPWLRNEERLRREMLSRELMPKSVFLHPIISRMSAQFPELGQIQYDSGKLQRLAQLLWDLKAGQHRVLVFTQMTSMLDILEQFLNYQGHTYLRLDGSTKVEQRQALMERFNTDKRIFCFILSTRSGGIGVNLTGADTIIFYDSDWNSTMDAQAQDTCHRIGQTRDVHIYRLICKKTIEENILKKAHLKRLLDNLPIEGGNFTTAFFKKDIIQDLFEIQEDPTTKEGKLEIHENMPGNQFKQALGLADEDRTDDNCSEKKKYVYIGT